MIEHNRTKNLFLIASILSLILLCFLAYGEVLEYYFTSIDAFPLLLIGKIDSFEDIFKLFSSPLGGGFPFGTYYRPISELSYGIDYLIWGKNPMGYHLTDILLHLANSIMAFTVAYIIFKERKMRILYAWISSVLFLLNPLNVGIIPSIDRRQDMLAALLLGLSLLSFAKMRGEENNRTLWYILSLFLGILAVFSKESAFVLPLLIWILSFIFYDTGGYREKAVRALKYSIPFFCIPVLNTALHIFFLGFWGVKIPSDIYRHVTSPAKSFFHLIDPINLLQLTISTKTILFLTIFLIVFVYLVRLIFKYGIRGFLDTLRSKKRRMYTFLILLIFTYIIMFAISGQASGYYHYLPNMAVILLIVMVLVDSFKLWIFSFFFKLLGAGFTLYTIIYSPIFTHYSAWQDTSEITKQVIEQTEEILNSDSKISRIYLVNWPAFIGLDSSLPGTSASILVNYSMNAWAELWGIKKHRDVEFIAISYTLFPSGDIEAEIKYTILDNRIIVNVERCSISFPNFPSYKGDLPFEFRIDDSKKRGELVFIRCLEPNERLFLYSLNGIRIIDGYSESIHEKLTFLNQKPKSFHPPVNSYGGPLNSIGSYLRKIYEEQI